MFSLEFTMICSAALNSILAWKVAGVLCLAKLASTILCYGTGGCGGIFSPNLFFGGMCGAVIGGIGSHFLALTDSGRMLLVVGGMSACLGAVVMAPVTAILIIFEMTHQFALIPGLMLAGHRCMPAWLPVRMNHANFYREILIQDGHQMEHIIHSPRFGGHGTICRVPPLQTSIPWSWKTWVKTRSPTCSSVRHTAISPLSKMEN